jgi:hypothetical protein
MSFAAITLCVASQRVFIVVAVYFVINSVRKLLDNTHIFPQLLTDNIRIAGTYLLSVKSKFDDM